MLARIKTGYTNGGRGLGMALMARFRSLPFTPNQVTVAGLSLNAVAAVLIYEEHFVWATVAFVTGSILDILDGALARSHGKLTQFGSFLDSTTDRISEGFVLGSIALVLSKQGHEAALASVFVALVGSFLVSYTRARAEALGLRGDVGFGSRAERVVMITAGLVFAPWGGLPWAIVALCATAWLTVIQRVLHVRTQLRSGGPSV